MCGGCGQSVASKIVGAVRLVQASRPLAAAITDADVAARRSLCEACDKWEHGKCMECHCFTWAKTRLPKQKCPLGKW